MGIAFLSAEDLSESKSIMKGWALFRQRRNSAGEKEGRTFRLALWGA